MLVDRLDTSWPVFRLKVWENSAQGKPFRRRPGYTDRIHSSLKDCERDGSQTFSLIVFWLVDPGRRRKASLPWAECSQAVGLTTQKYQSSQQTFHQVL